VAVSGSEVGRQGRVSTDAAELSSIQGTLEELSQRVAAIAERRDSDPDDPISPGLFEVERSLRNAVRRLDRLRGSI
jgi:hypothetical protein